MSPAPSVLIMHTRLRDLTTAEQACLSACELQRCNGIASASRRREYLCGRALLRTALERWNGQPAETHRLATTEEGKPVCVDGPAVSLTHSGDLVACAIASSGQIGIDVEMPGARRRTRDIAEIYFSADEAVWLRTQAESRFYMLWVLKEAYLKAVGCGLRGLDYLRCRVEPPAIEASVADDALRCLGLYQSATALLALAARHLNVEAVKLEHWVAGREIAKHCAGFHALAMANDFA